MLLFLEDFNIYTYEAKLTGIYKLNLVLTRTILKFKMINSGNKFGHVFTGEKFKKSNTNQKYF